MARGLELGMRFGRIVAVLLDVFEGATRSSDSCKIQLGNTVVHRLDIFELLLQSALIVRTHITWRTCAWAGTALLSITRSSPGVHDCCHARLRLETADMLEITSGAGARAVLTGWR